MKLNHIITLFTFIVIKGCTPKLKTQTAIPTNYEVKDHKGNIILLGKSTRERLTQPPFDSWFNKNYKNYTIDSNTVNRIKPLVKNKQFILFMGTWCGDSRREVPRIYKLLDYAGIKKSQVQLVNLNNHDSAYKKSPGGEEKGLDIRRVPTLLIYENNRELGRIVETPVVSWEKDMQAILTRRPYQHRYSAAF